MYRFDQKAPANVAEPEELRLLQLNQNTANPRRKSMLAARDVTWHDITFTIAIC